MHKSEASHIAVPKHQRPPIWTKEATGFHKRVKWIHDPVKIVVPCVVLEAESPIPPDRSMQISSYIEVLDDHQHVEASQIGLRFRDEVDKGPAEAASIDTDQIPSNDIKKPTSIDATTSPSIDTGRESEQKEFDVCGDLRDGDTTTRSDKSGGKKRRNWNKRKRIKDGPQIFGASTREDHRARQLVDIEELESIDTHDMVSIDREARRKPVWSQPT
ncbi:hypothetical protein F2Q69_00058645 [Brassica cretica]|uniref:Uncharacterized protein n=1 Tax=Brassica cretica TaxID=69181 RepID=A0A8S9RR76_BRACR|nr:hypothetical protein F2Q69_00058645 [Brassica cretica]